MPTPTRPSWQGWATPTSPRGLPLPDLGTPLTSDGYALYVSRWERENNPLLVARAHAASNSSIGLVMLGHAARLHGRIAVSAAARHFIDRFFPGDYKVIPNGVDVPRFAGRLRRAFANGRSRQLGVIV